nr:MAG TPA: hypothetical protein [Caudoviricetes sp.]DAQ90646.1 MAG TPA: hypothetical protein [Caudoviricetes sp.]
MTRKRQAVAHIPRFIILTTMETRLMKKKQPGVSSENVTRTVTC